MPKRILIQCSTQVNRDAVTRKTIAGIEHIIIASATLPDDIVMNGGLYSAEEISKGFMSLEGSLAPVEHPTDASGLFISATDATAINNFYAGAFNANVRRENGRVFVDKVVNVPEALKTDRGKRLLDRVAELETNDDPRPIHTSVGVFLDVVELDEPQTNAAGIAYTWTAHNLAFDHDAILLDSVGAAQPDQGVGMAVNAAGDEIEVQRLTLSDGHDDLGEMSHNEVREALQIAISSPPISGDWVTDVFDDRVIFWIDEQLFTAPYVLDNGIAKIMGLPVPVIRDVSYIPKTNHHEKDDMKELMLKALADAGLSVNADISDADLLAQYNALQIETNSGEGTQPGTDVAAVVANAVAEVVKPLAEQVTGLAAKFAEQDDAEITRMAEIVGNAEQYQGIDVEAAKAIPVDTLRTMAANCGTSYGLPLTNIVGGDGGNAEHTYDMPE